jgi:hypothetical protein
LIVCDNVLVDAESGLVCIIDLISSITPRGQEPRYRYVHPELCVFAQLTGCRGPGRVQVVCVRADDEQPVFGSQPRGEFLSDDPLEIVGLRFRIRNCAFPEPGLYLVRFLFNDQVIADTPLRLR